MTKYHSLLGLALNYPAFNLVCCIKPVSLADLHDRRLVIFGISGLCRIGELKPSQFSRLIACV